MMVRREIRLAKTSCMATGIKWNHFLLTSTSYRKWKLSRRRKKVMWAWAGKSNFKFWIPTIKFFINPLANIKLCQWWLMALTVSVTVSRECVPSLAQAHATTVLLSGPSIELWLIRLLIFLITAKVVSREKKDVNAFAWRVEISIIFLGMTIVIILFCKSVISYMGIEICWDLS